MRDRSASKMNTSANRWTPHWAIHPGQHLLECIQSRGLSVEDFADRTDLPATTLDAIIAGRHPITYDIALRIERSFGIMPDFWFLLQSKWHRQQETMKTPA
ncbi:HigA family addiction module antidote protein [Phyllobacterium sp. SYP-B3895]|nr:HigA family addiction module antidote protein [Phyllobacterium sp. SYP-B3895]